MADMCRTMLVTMTLLTLMGIARGQECVIRERDVISSDYDRPLSDCPCYHHSSANYSCPAPASSRDIVSSPLVPCNFLPRQFLQCAKPHDHKGNETTYNKMGHGCLKYGGQRWEEVEKSKACCRALDCIECSGPRTFLRDGFPCIRYTNHYFVTTLLYSILLGFLGLDRCYCVHRVMVLTLQIIVLAQVLSRSHRDWSGETVNARWLGHLVGGGYLPPGHGSYSSR